MVIQCTDSTSSVHLKTQKCGINSAPQYIHVMWILTYQVCDFRVGLKVYV